VNPGLPTNTMWGGICFHAAAYAMFCFTPRKGVWTVNREATQYTDFGFSWKEQREDEQAVNQTCTELCVFECDDHH
jgi:hypothetical protein